MFSTKQTFLLSNNRLEKGFGHMKKFAQRALAALKDESGQGATEYILLLVVVVALVFMFKGKILKIGQSAGNFIIYEKFIF